MSRQQNLLVVRIVNPLTWPALWGASAVVAGIVFAAADASRRTTWPEGSRMAVFADAVTLCVGGSLLLGLLIALALGVGQLVAWPLGRRWPWMGHSLSAIWYSICVAAATWHTAVWTFSGSQIRTTSYAAWGPYAFVAFFCVISLVLIVLTRHALRSAARRALWWPLLLAMAYGSTAAALIQVDLRAFVALYQSLHATLEGVAAILIISAMLLLLAVFLVRCRSAISAVAAAVTLFSALLAVVNLATEGSRARLMDRLDYGWREELYVGRMLRRLAQAEAFAVHGAAPQGVELVRLDSLRTRFDIVSAGRSPRWDEPWYEPPGVYEATVALRGAPDQFSVIVYYVDTLRADTAADPEVMPRVAGFGADNLMLASAYSSGSDTIRSLPGLTGGNYDFLVPKGNDLLDVARAAGLKRVLGISDSAAAFLKTHRPEFAFDEQLTVPDHAPGKEVWGYGADSPTAAALVDDFTAWLEKNPATPFFYWIFNYDQHAWREFNEDYLRREAKRLGMPHEDEPGLQPWRYRTVARLVDEQFGRLMDQVAALGQAESTIVVFVSDHGESLGREGFMVHSVFLWEELVRVPLIIKVPGLGAHRVEKRVSLVDVAPTLARYLLEEPLLDGYHGEDLLTYLQPERPERHFPIVMGATSKLTLARVGLIDEGGRWKLVLPFESATPELYDLDSAETDTKSVAEKNPAETLRLLSDAVGSPLFPRSPADFQAYVFH